MDLISLNELQPPDATAEFLKCCGSVEWARRMTEARPFESLEQLRARAGEIWWTLDRHDWLEAFRSHPKIGGRQAAQKVSEQARAWSGEEQASVKSAPDRLLDELAKLNQQYDERFGFIFIVCATGKMPDEMLGILKSRLGNDTETEIRIAASEQERITEIRLSKLIVATA